MNFIRLTVLVEGQYLEVQVHLDNPDPAQVVSALDQMFADMRARFTPEAES
jgi:hypothetical protein